MASAQQAMVMNEEEKAVVEKMVEVAKSIGPSQNEMTTNAKDQQWGAVVAMTNSTSANVNFSQSHDYYGHVLQGGYPKTIAKAGHASFTHMADAKNGSKSAVVYLGANKAGLPCGWLLAWCAPVEPSPTSRNKVYATCGPASKFQHVNWSQVLKDLDASSDIVNFYDPTTKTAIHGNIQPGEKFASVGASFGAV